MGLQPQHQEARQGLGVAQGPERPDFLRTAGSAARRRAPRVPAGGGATAPERRARRSIWPAPRAGPSAANALWPCPVFELRVCEKTYCARDLAFRRCSESSCISTYTPVPALRRKARAREWPCLARRGCNATSLRSRRFFTNSQGRPDRGLSDTDRRDRPRSTGPDRPPSAPRSAPDRPTPRPRT